MNGAWMRTPSRQKRMSGKRKIPERVNSSQFRNMVIPVDAGVTKNTSIDSTKPPNRGFLFSWHFAGNKKPGSAGFFHQA